MDPSSEEASEVNPLSQCGYCSTPVTGYDHNRRAVIMHGIRDFGPEEVVVQPCGCVCQFPEFVQVDEELVSMPPLGDPTGEPTEHMIISVAIIDQLNEVDVLEFDDILELSECDDE